ncbi:MAG: exodeoxyribonuclease VII small subunit [Bacillota bacterium]|jgi:exodeoxyribonuclease VII small subunit
MKKKLSFEEAFCRLEEIIKEMEEEQKPLEELLSVFAEGVKMLETCRNKLDKAEEKMQQTIAEIKNS